MFSIAVVDNVFLRLMSSSSPSFEPSLMLSRHFSSVFFFFLSIIIFSVLLSFTSRLYFERVLLVCVSCVFCFFSSSDKKSQSSAYCKSSGRFDFEISLYLVFMSRASIAFC